MRSSTHSADSMRSSTRSADQPDTVQISTRLLEAIAGVVAESHAGRRVSVALDSDFGRDLGLDSLARAEMLLRVGEVFGTALPDEALSDARSPRDLLPYLGHSVAADVVVKTHALPSDEAGVPAHARSLTEALEWHASRHPKRLHVLLYVDHGEPQEISYGMLRDAARRIAAGLRGVRAVLRDRSWLPRRGPVEFEIGAVLAPTGADWAAAIRLRDSARAEILRLCGEPDLGRR